MGCFGLGCGLPLLWVLLALIWGAMFTPKYTGNRAFTVYEERAGAGSSGIAFMQVECGDGTTLNDMKEWADVEYEKIRSTKAGLVVNFHIGGRDADHLMAQYSSGSISSMQPGFK
jgi:hypothetical protein